MLVLGVVLIVVAVILGIFGFLNAAVSALLWIGVALAVIGIVLIVLPRFSNRSQL
jgi:drug/metabolite transporter (DMT)-like permease